MLMGVLEDSNIEIGEAEEVDGPGMNHLKPFDMEPRRKIHN